MKIKQTDLAYIAGFVDGEGCVSLTKKSDLVGSKRYYSIVPVVVVANTKKFVLDYMNNLFGGYVAEHRLSAKTIKKWNFHKHKVIYHYELSYNKAIKFLQAIYPYLKIKKKQADVLFAFKKLMDKGKELGTKSKAHKKLYPKKLKLKNKIHKLNGRGKK